MSGMSQNRVEEAQELVFVAFLAHHLEEEVIVQRVKPFGGC